MVLDGKGDKLLCIRQRSRNETKWRQGACDAKSQRGGRGDKFVECAGGGGRRRRLRFDVY